MSAAASPRFERREYGVYALDPMPDVLQVSDALLDHCRRLDWGLEVRGDIVDFRLANGRFVYRVVDRAPEVEIAICRIVYREEW